MIQPYAARASLAGRLVLAVDRLLTWGMEPAARQAVLAEQAADWEAMSQDGSDWKMIARQLKGVPLAIWWRLAQRDITAIPAALALSVAALGTVLEVAVPDYPVAHRLSLLLISVGLATAAGKLLRRPRRIVVAEWRVSALLVGVGATGSALTYPTQTDWSYYDAAQMSAPAIDLTMQIAAYVVAAGCAVLVAASMARRRRRTALVAGVLILAGALLLAGAQVVWGIRASPIDLYVTAATLAAAFGVVLFTHMVLRLRKLDIS